MSEEFIQWQNLTTVEDSQLIRIRKLNSAREYLLALEIVHQKFTSSNKVMLFKRICRITIAENGNMENHIKELMNLLGDKFYKGIESKRLRRSYFSNGEQQKVKKIILEFKYNIIRPKYTAKSYAHQLKATWTCPMER